MKMRFLKKFVLAGLVAPLLFSLLSFTNAVAGEGKVVTIRVCEICKGCTGKAGIQIAEEGNSRFIELEKFNPSTPEQSNNLIAINNLLEEYRKAGFNITSTFIKPLIGASSITTYILTK